jgi:uncharacterized membrane protein (UPF0127 family)
MFGGAKRVRLEHAASAVPNAGRRRLCASALTLALLLVATGCTAAPGGQSVALRPEGGPPVPIRVEIAATPDARELGLMYRDTLAPDAGMLFVFPRREPVSFWMKNTKLPLDIVFIADDGEIVAIHANTKPFSEAPLPSVKPVRFVLEVAGGTCAAHGVKQGDRVDLGALAQTPSS